MTGCRSEKWEEVGRRKGHGPKWPASARIRNGEGKKWSEKKAEMDLNGRPLSGVVNWPLIKPSRNRLPSPSALFGRLFSGSAQKAKFFLFSVFHILFSLHFFHLGPSLPFCYMAVYLQPTALLSRYGMESHSKGASMPRLMACDV